MAKQPDKPVELCRFRRYAASGRNEGDDNAVYDLLHGRLRFADINTFNDPFEARPQYVKAFENVGKQRAAMLKYLESVARAHKVPSPRAWAKQRITGKTQQEIVDEVDAMDMRQGLTNVITVLCLSEPRAVNTPLPWSHYADSHRGVCVHLDTAIDPLRFIYPVKYCEEYPKIVVPRTEQDRWESVQSKLLSKCAHWQYEHEWRCIRQTIRPESPSANLFVDWDGAVALAPSAIVKAVTIGAMMPPPARDKLTAWVREHVPHVEVWQARLHRSRYEIERDRVR